MDSIIYIPYEEFATMWNEMKERMRFNCPEIHPSLKNVTVKGLSGKGTKFKNEYERIMHEHFNPKMPLEIRMFTEDGIVTYRVRERSLVQK
jgi:hypothetical protein